MNKTILITGSNGNVSSNVISSLKGSKTKIRALVRTEEKAKALKDQGIDVVIGDLSQPKTLDKAFDGVDSAWLLATATANAPELMSQAIWASKKHGVSHVVRMSAVGAAHNAPTINSRLHALSDAELAASGISYTIVKPHFFFQNLMMGAKSVATEGTFAIALGDAKLGMIDSRDIGEFAAKVLMTGGHDNKTYTLTGPTSIDMSHVVEQLGVVLKKTVKYVPLTLEQQAQGMAAMGMDNYGVNMMNDYMAAYSNNWGDFVTSDFQNVMGKAPRAFTDFARDFGTAFGAK